MSKRTLKETSNSRAGAVLAGQGAAKQVEYEAARQGTSGTANTDRWKSSDPFNLSKTKGI